MRASVRYTLARLFVFFACLFVLWLVGLRDPILLLLVAATLSLVLSMWLLSGMREQMSREVYDRVEARTQRKTSEAQKRRDAEVLSDDEAEDVEIERRSRDPQDG
ncbi:DUF4229 domain-containing protein [Agilicoccus flavus]|uniref:DUF4229 domain-containing protein n=1 Tax=Agilicoccus flavus TaxID=2775968 RepID=UPI001CF60A83|nr:DUF4229 domain-containing protein [Agilicoccus flavus]